jgi:hypothetical protein
MADLGPVPTSSWLSRPSIRHRAGFIVETGPSSDTIAMPIPAEAMASRSARRLVVGLLGGIGGVVLVYAI